MPTPLSIYSNTWAFYWSNLTAVQRGIPYLLLSFFALPFSLSAQAQDMLYGITYRYGSIAGYPHNSPGSAYVVYSMKSDGTQFTELKTLDDSQASTPVGNLMEGSDGFLYGVTKRYDGFNWNGGYLYKLRRDGVGYEVIQTFPANDSLTPMGGLVRGSDGFLYGVVAKTPRYAGYPWLLGYIFKLSNDGSTFTVLKTFSGPDGSGPVGNLVQRPDGFLYGTTAYGGTYDKGVLFKIKPDGTGFSILKSFTDAAQNRTSWNLVKDNDGILFGLGGLVKGKDEAFYGTFPRYYDTEREQYISLDGGVFKFSDENFADYTIIKEFESTEGNAISQLVEGSDGFFYGVLDESFYITHYGSYGGIYKIKGDGSEFSIIQPSMVGSNMIMGNLLLLPPATCQASGSILRELWANVPGDSISTIPVSTPPTLTSQLTSFRTPASYGDNYGQRIRGYLCTPATGNYQFFIQGDDNAELYLSSDDDPAHKQKVANVHVSWGWTNQPAQQSGMISLVAGKRYYVEALQKEALGGDVLRVAWRTPGMVTGSEPVIIPGAVLSPYQLPTQTPLIYEVYSASTSSNIRLNWFDLRQATSYVIERATSPTGPYTQIGMLVPTYPISYYIEYDDASGLPNTTYYYRIYATTAQGATAYSNVVSATTPGSCTATGSILRELWANVPVAASTTFPLTRHPR